MQTILCRSSGKHFPSRAVGALFNYVIVPAIWPDNAQVTSSRKKKISPGSHFHKNILVEYSTETTAIDSNIWVSWISAQSVVQKLYPPEFICQCVLSFDLWISCCFVAAQLLFQNNGITLWKEDKQQENNRNNFSIFLFPRSEIKAKTFQQKLVLTGYKQ